MATTVSPISPTTPTYVPLQTITLSSAASSVTFSSIPGDYLDLVLAVDANTVASGRSVIQVNGDTSSTYNSIMISDGDYSAAASGTFFDPMPGYSITGRFSALWNFNAYSQTRNKYGILVRLNQHDGNHLHFTGGDWSGTSPITSIKILTNSGVNYGINSVFSLYGVGAS